MIVTVECPACKGNKKIMGDGLLMQNCKTCDGSGTIKANMLSDETNGEVLVCPTCEGCGKIWEEKPSTPRPLVIPLGSDDVKDDEKQKSIDLTVPVLRRRRRSIKTQQE